MKNSKPVSPGKAIELAVLPFDGDAEAEQRVRTILELAISIGRREGLIGTNLLNPSAGLPKRLLSEKLTKQGARSPDNGVNMGYQTDEEEIHAKEEVIQRTYTKCPLRQKSCR